ncbi:Transcription and mRNA export factor eny2 [Characodon lateralis]|uniref:Transcription and mRNA export factor ENY2 n=2 Tax=Goodeidae TaxID=28758 RepID=A0ABU7F402_9TELE|nr:Transcription and mRNA export factor eny2 [Characodon lateralis]
MSPLVDRKVLYCESAPSGTIKLQIVPEIMSKEYQMRAAINQKLIEMGERERLKELLRAKLVECGWKDQLKAHCKDVIREKGLEHVTVEDLVTEVTPKGRALVPDSVKKELLQRIRAFLVQHAAL